ncbi:hypothetical protein KJ665_03200 [Patescibacteria group bacterium]|nr:hypothetical protein [Patescibacteria group bacterium]
MRKNILITVLALLVFALPVLAAVTDFTADGNIVVSGVTLYGGSTTDNLLILDTSTSESFNFASGVFTVTNPGSAFKVGSAESTVKSVYVLKSGVEVACATNPTPGTSYVTLPTTAADYIVYPSTATGFATTDCCSSVSQAATYNAFPTCGPATCISGYYVSGASCVQIAGGGVSGSSGSGGSSSVTNIGLVSMPTTATGQVTATAAGGGKTTLTTPAGATATVQLPINAVSSDTVITITQVADTAAAIANEVAAVPATLLMVGNSIYSFSAMSGTTNITAFNQNITLTFTYTDAQIAGLAESALTVYYWNTATSAWTALTTTVNAATNTLTVTTNHFTDFAILGSPGQDIAEGALIRAIGDIDVYIVKYMGSKQFKRLILSPSVFNSYEHLKWGDVLDVDKSVVDSFTTSELVRTVNDTKVYKLYPAGDTGQKRWVQTAEGFNRMGFDWDAIYEINAVDRNSYVTGANIE